MRKAKYNEVKRGEKISGFGKDDEEAILDLTKECLRRGTPIPEHMNNKYFCGTVTIVTRRLITSCCCCSEPKEICYNPVFFEDRNDRVHAFTFYN